MGGGQAPLDRGQPRAYPATSQGDRDYEPHSHRRSDWLGRNKLSHAAYLCRNTEEWIKLGDRASARFDRVDCSMRAFIPDGGIADPPGHEDTGWAAIVFYGDRVKAGVKADRSWTNIL